MTAVGNWLLVRLLASSSEGAEGFSLVSVHPGTIIWTIIIFVILVLLLGKLLWKPILKAVAEREKRIRDALEGAERAKAEAAQALEEQKKVIEQQRKETAALIAKAREEAREEGERLLQKAKAEAVELTERARRQIEEEKAAVLREIRAYAVDLSIASASHLLGKTLDQETHRRIVQQYIDSLPEAISGKH